MLLLVVLVLGACAGSPTDEDLIGVWRTGCKAQLTLRDDGRFIATDLPAALVPAVESDPFSGAGTWERVAENGIFLTIESPDPGPDGVGFLLQLTRAGGEVELAAGGDDAMRFRRTDG